MSYFCLGLSILQNGKIPQFIEHNILEELFSDKETASKCIRNLREGLAGLGLIRVSWNPTLNSL